MDLSLFATLPALIMSLCSLSESIDETWIIILQNWYHLAITYITIENMYLFSWRFRYTQRHSWIIQNYYNKHIVEAKFRLRCKSWKKKIIRHAVSFLFILSALALSNFWFKFTSQTMKFPRFTSFDFKVILKHCYYSGPFLISWASGLGRKLISKF